MNDDWNQSLSWPFSGPSSSEPRPIVIAASPGQSTWPFSADEIRRIVHDPVDQEHADHADGHVDVEHPRPGVLVGEPAAQGRAHGRRQHRAEAEEGSIAVPCSSGGEALPQDGLRDGDDHAAAGALDRAEQDHQRHRAREPAGHRGDGEQDDARQVEALAARTFPGWRRKLTTTQKIQLMFETL